MQAVPSQTKQVMASHPPGSTQKRPSLWKGGAHPQPSFLTSDGGAEGVDAGAFTQVGGSQPVDQGQEQVPLTPI